MCRVRIAVIGVLVALILPRVAVGLTGPEALAKQVTIRRDTFGVPHILAESEEAAAFANSYVAAEDHCEEIARLYLKAKSREAAYFGKGFIEDDCLTKRLGLYDAAADGYKKSPQWMRQILDGYAAGFNHYVEQHRKSLPSWVETVTPPDVLAHAMRVVNIEFASDLAQLSLIDKRQAAASQPPAPGSNMYAVNKARSATGHAMLLGNPHLAWFGSQVWHELHLTVPGVINAYGASLIGLPGIEIGFTEQLGWSHTVNEHDSTDLYELSLAPADHESYLFEGQVTKMGKREITIDVLVDGKIREHSETAYDSRFGPVVAFRGDKAYALKSPNFGEYRMLEQWSRMAKARTFDEFKGTLDLQGIAMFNICYADIEGNSFYISNGRFPRRPPGYDWRGVVPGNGSATEWTEILSPGELPQLSNPPGGYVHNSNNSPWYTSLAAPMDKAKFPADVFPDENDLRSQLGLRLIDSDPSLTFEEMLANKLNPRLLLAERVKESLIAASKGDASLREAAATLENWDNSVSRESRGSVLFTEFWTLYESKAEHDFAQEWDPARPMDTPQGLGEPALAAQLLGEAAMSVKKKYGALDVAWGDVHRLRQGHVDVPIGGFEGESGAYRVIFYRRDADGKMKALGGDSFVFAVEFSRPLHAVSIMPYGESGDLASPHHDDQAVLFADGKFKDVWFSEDAITKHTERSYRP